jgi:excisionase family DNA binding protein
MTAIDLAEREPAPSREPLAHSVEAACVMTGLGKTTIYGLIKAKKLESVKVGKRRLLTHRGIVKLATEGLA